MSPSCCRALTRRPQICFTLQLCVPADTVALLVAARLQEGAWVLVEYRSPQPAVWVARLVQAVCVLRPGGLVSGGGLTVRLLDARPKDVSVSDGLLRLFPTPLLMASDDQLVVETRLDNPLGDVMSSLRHALYVNCRVDQQRPFAHRTPQRIEVNGPRDDDAEPATPGAEGVPAPEPEVPESPPRSPPKSPEAVPEVVPESPPSSPPERRSARRTPSKFRGRVLFKSRSFR